MHDNILYYVWLSCLNLIPEKRVEVLNEFGSPKKAFEASADEIHLSNLCSNTKNVLLQKNLSVAHTVIEDSNQKDISIIPLGDPRYPKLLSEIIDPPIVLYVKGIIPDTSFFPPIAMIGTRNPSVYAVKMAKKFSYDIALGNMLVVSGLARGIDTLCHRGALTANKPTIAVLGCGPDVVYPSENSEIQRLISENGAIISEFPPGTAPHAMNFPLRNRIISGLSLGVFVIEGTPKSGTMITIRTATEQGRQVFTIPTNLDNPKGLGNLLLLQQGTKLVTNVTDIFEEFLLNYPEQIINAMGNPESKTNLSSTQQNILEIIQPSTPIHIDEICRKVGQSAAEINVNLTMLELEGLITRLPGKTYIRT